MKKTLIVDMDGVLADIYQQYIIWEIEETGTKIEMEDVLGMSETEAFPNCLKHIEQKGFFRNPPVIFKAQETLQKLNEIYNVFIVSSATEYPNSLEEKYHWLREYFPFISWQQIVFCGDKSIVKGDIMIDDHFKNLDSFDGKTILFTQPHNYMEDESRHLRVKNWDEINELLLSSIVCQSD